MISTQLCFLLLLILVGIQQDFNAHEGLNLDQEDMDEVFADPTANEPMQPSFASAPALSIGAPVGVAHVPIEAPVGVAPVPFRRSFPAADAMVCDVLLSVCLIITRST